MSSSLLGGEAGAGPGCNLTKSGASVGRKRRSTQMKGHTDFYRHFHMSKQKAP